MSLATICLISVALGVDAFAVALGIGLAGISLKEIFLISGLIGFFHVLMPGIGLQGGASLGKIWGSGANLLGGFILLAIGLNMMLEGLRQEEACFNWRTYGGLFLMVLSVSLDALAVGLGLGSWPINFFLTVVVMGFIVTLMTLSGFFLGQGLGRLAGPRACLGGGFVLVLVGIKFLGGFLR